MDILLLMETWLSSKDQTWIDCYEFNRDPFKIYTAHRGNDKRGGGLGLITKSNYRVKKIRTGKYKSFEFATWQIDCKRIKLTLTSVYHPPYSLRSKITNNQFIDQFITYISEILPNHNNHIIMGDFNLYLSKDDNTDATIFQDSIEALDLYQYISFPTHNSENLLDLVISEIGGIVNIMTTAPGPFVSDQCATITDTI